MSNGWGKVYGDLVFSRKWMEAGMAARGLWTTALSFCIAQKTHGNLESHMVAFLGGNDELAAELVAVGLWDEIEGGYRFHDWEDHQGTEERMARRTEASRANGAKGGRPRKTAGQKVTERKPEEPNGNPAKPSENLEKPSETKTEPRKPTEQEQEQEQEQEVNPPTPQRGAYPPDFEDFWAIYPKHAGKRDAFKAWKAAVKRTDRETINAGARAYADDPNREPTFTKHPATWLRADSWEDDPIPTRGVSETVKAIDSVNAYRLMQDEMAWPLELERRRA